MLKAYVALGANLGEPALQIEAALNRLAQLPETRLPARSRLYRSAPLGPAGQPDYCNAVAALETGLEPHALLDHLQAIERDAGRVRGERWGARYLDLDLLLHGDCRIDDERLKLPHPELANRVFVLQPLAEIAPALELPGHGPISARLAALPHWEIAPWA
ncbi:2-amino-4-hydroxy-6-hydroxymethyldihydropteridine diphosphokinase [Stagnimonas aquatica]|uniref:2-amino-4-hydroxy-6-hydroxymethyldihydropteridine pyrophosphokinase n=1 Tax=Stagnimonas aquatica TaxID=2689987 RepID=A0A3N0V592_9GAMM|nr:2-amino-4-hydroxy-6-hydroxymethyldihydropteridine diphosphokinase [Stagnimonas aquatica]ROH87883.1 2-amino-4-hydroxy-6-hydroxymethyldihydropteridine diphosphokinase [Stagnimonas aquatica]